ncbi:hypothetical protein BAUCODRAFT_34717 [Baudoinia panamericana UAMH 10762]|uniref:MI domain-containing protein n=1 Tax=Baudoinia panamericana (strain UAMH 10762) TaxID=717646 RepID=M2NAT7_BAUPA|nr:uncharacterized protein BAUCODRAFT_34717 [Baudoinia panamericana UAMH 10762]EMC95955.1 hypothetical protein BAUCODRAFT_34717 [Baudoinia panamericana UAMH 10762]
MRHATYRGPKLPKDLLDQLGGPQRRHVFERKRHIGERRNAPGARSRPARNAHGHHAVSDDGEQDRFSKPIAYEKPPNSRVAKAQKSILKPSKTTLPQLERADELDEASDDQADFDLDEQSDDSDGSFTVSRHAAKAGIADEDADIAALERKLGVKARKRSQGDEDDNDLDWLAGSSDEDDERGVKRKRPEDANWLIDKRFKASQPSDSEDFEGFESGSDSEATPPAKTKRENPYVAPVPQDRMPTAKYIPPSLRKPASSDEEALKQLRRQMQGQLNRLSEANLLSIVQALEGFYEKNARQHVTSTVIDLLISLVADESILSDAFLLLHAGFAAALYKVTGTDFGAQLLEKLVNTFDQHLGVGDSHGKQALNLVAFLSCLYSLQVVGSNIMFDYIRLLLDELTEDNTELLLRVIRTAGPQLRQDDPSALKDIVLLLQRKVADTAEANFSVRTMFMIDSIRDLKNNRMKAGAAGSATVAEHTVRIRKTLGSLNARSVRATEPLRITLADLEDTEKKGKWWLVGASYHDPAKPASNGGSMKPVASLSSHDADAGYESDTPGHVNLTKAAIAQGMNTDIRRAIFVSIVGAEDFKHAYLRLRSLNLTSKQKTEVPRVVLHCLGAEQTVYNPYYAVVARKLCEEEGVMRKAFQARLWEHLKRMRRADEDDVDSEDDEGGGGDGAGMSVPRMVLLAKFYATLMASGAVSIAALKGIDFQSQRPETKAYSFAEVLLTTLLLQLRKTPEKLEEVFTPSGANPKMLGGLRWFMRTIISKAALASGEKEARRIKEACNSAISVLPSGGSNLAPVVGVDSDDD